MLHKLLKINEGNKPKALENCNLRKFTIKLDEKQKKRKVRIEIEIDHNSILNIKGFLIEKKFWNWN